MGREKCGFLVWSFTQQYGRLARHLCTGICTLVRQSALRSQGSRQRGCVCASCSPRHHCKQHQMHFQAHTGSRRPLLGTCQRFDLQIRQRHRSTPHSTVHGKVGKVARPRMRAQGSDKGTSGKRNYTRRSTLPQHAAGDKVFEKSSVNQRRLQMT